MKKLLMLLLIFCSMPLIATEQSKDNIIINGQEGMLEMSWQYPSPIQSYFKQNNQKYPFVELSTGNYRGHIATWELKDNKLYLTQIGIPKDFLSDKLNNVELTDVFPKKIVKDKEVFANWFSGYLLAHTDLEEVAYVSPEGEVSDTKYPQYQKKSIFKVTKGEVVETKSFDYDEYWSLVSKSYAYNNLDRESREIVHEYLTYTHSFFTPEEKESMSGVKRSKEVLTEDDFEVFLERVVTKNVKIPLSDLTVIKDVSFNPKSNGWHSETGYRVKNGSSVLYMEMGSTNIPSGPWSNYVGGSLQVAIPLNSLVIGKQQIGLNQVKYINNYAQAEKKNKTIEIDFEINEVTSEHILLSGKVIFKSENPSTYQEIKFEKNKVPILSLLDYLKIHQNDSDFFPYKAEEVYEKILKKSK